MKRCVQIATVTSVMGLAASAAADEPGVVVYPPPMDAPPAAPSPPREAPAVGGEGRWVLDLVGGQLGPLGLGPLGFFGPLAISSSASEQATPDGKATTKQTSLALAPSLDVFVTERLSVGGRVTAGVVSTSIHQPFHGQPPYELDTHGFITSFEPRIGYVIPISSSFAFWPRAGVGYQMSRQTNDVTDRRALTRTYSVESNLGVGLRLSRHALFDVGPVLAFRHVESEGQDALGGYALTDGASSTFAASIRASLRLDF